MLENAPYTSNCEVGLFITKLETRWDSVTKELQLVLQLVCGCTFLAGKA
jgi:hypothetical protein